MLDGFTMNDGSETAPVASGGGILGRINSAIGQPFAAPVTWGRLALIVGFILICLIAWRQVVLYIAGEK
jgi:hypothetical protein